MEPRLLLASTTSVVDADVVVVDTTKPRPAAATTHQSSSRNRTAKNNTTAAGSAASTMAALRSVDDEPSPSSSPAAAPKPRPRGCICCKTPHRGRRALMVLSNNKWNQLHNGNGGGGISLGAGGAAAVGVGGAVVAADPWRHVESDGKGNLILDLDDPIKATRSNNNNNNNNNNLGVGGATAAAAAENNNFMLEDIVLAIWMGGPILPFPRVHTPTIKDPEVAKQIARYATSGAQQMAKNGGDYCYSMTMQERTEKLAKLGIFEWEELQLGKLLGVGGFSQVHEIAAFHTRDNKSDDQVIANAQISPAKNGDTTSTTKRRASYHRSHLCHHRAATSESTTSRTLDAVVASSCGETAANDVPCMSSSVLEYTRPQLIAREFVTKHASRRTATDNTLSSRRKQAAAAANNNKSVRNVTTTLPPRSSSHSNRRFQSKDELSDIFRETRESMSTVLDTSTCFFAAAPTAAAAASGGGDDRDEDDDNDSCHGKGKTTMKISRYAVKHLRPSLLNETPFPNKFTRAAVDLACEAEILLSLDHPNIIKLRGWSTGGPDSYRQGRHTSYFLIVDRLMETVQDRIDTWRKVYKARYSLRSRANRLWRRGLRAAGRVLLDRTAWKRRQKRKERSRTNTTSHGKDKTGTTFSKSPSTYPSPRNAVPVRDELLEERLKVAYDIASALKYCHEKRIIYRDLKPSNIGFDIRGDVKIFDFGLARHLPDADINGTIRRRTSGHDGDDEEEATIDEPYQMSPVGTRMYQAPEVRSRKPYNLKADVFSFGIVLWEIMSMSTPKSIRGYNDDGQNWFALLPICPCWPQQIKYLIVTMTAEDARDRPTMKQVCATLEEVIASCYDTTTWDVMHLSKQPRRRSTFSMERIAVETLEGLVDDSEEGEAADESVHNPSTTSVGSHSRRSSSSSSPASDGIDHN